ncbi:hypothetical protein M011DRAFT_394083 [Sporormia fimetaria CBS 119925]|uniref:EGF-like domain-containing protein n=1 Tax=Sporormia fimetaria CBS 119925 TaxID=1340428 RepID=A0A6A6VN06_9PLEO|nr:hypothetical protein M011DRAFT_394083 [Sporormia fimetaria CBS 119925]
MGVDDRQGSVGAAGEHAQRIAGLPQRPNQLVSHFSPQTQQQQTPTSQWPLPTDAQASNLPPNPTPPGRVAAPQRPPRLVANDDDYRFSYQSEDVLSPASATTSSRPLTTSSALSEASSLGSIPDFPVPLPAAPAAQSQARRQPSLGPPPSARRGPPSYYTQASYVSPIAEESETRSLALRSKHGSMASSSVFPANDEYYKDGASLRSDDDETITSDNGRASRGSDHDEKSELVQPALVRQASLGRRTKPSLMTIKSVDSLDRKKSLKRKPTPPGAGKTVDTAAIGGAVLAARDGLAGRHQGPSLSGSSVLIDPSSSSEESLTHPKMSTLRFRSLDPEKDDFVTSAYGGGAKPSALSERLAARRPPRIDVDAVREAEARGSLTSLPELIKRATRLAANLDRGKTASRLGLDFWESGAPDKLRRSLGSLSDMLAAFPPPGEATPTGSRTPRALRNWDSKGADYGRSPSEASSHASQRRRRCCGMPMWTFITLLIVLLFLIAAAVVIPVVLIVLPKLRTSQAAVQPTASQGTAGGNVPQLPAPTSNVQNNQCNGSVTCQNGGVAILNADLACNCVCINGFTGRACETRGDAGCTTMNVSGAAENATLGSGIPRLFEAAERDFSVPLDPPTVLSIFSDLGLSCNAENALVTFNGLSTRSVTGLDSALKPSRSLPLQPLDGNKFFSDLARRQTVGQPGENNQDANPTPTPGLRTDDSPAPTVSISRNTTAIDFARVAILLLLQETRELETTANAQVAIQDFLTGDRASGARGSTVDLGVFEIDLAQLSIVFQNGTVFQAQAEE